MKDFDFFEKNTLIFDIKQPLTDKYLEYIDKGLIFTPCLKIKTYNPKVPIYVKDEDEKIYELSVHPNRKSNWSCRNAWVETMFTYIPFLKFKELSESEIDVLKNYSTTSFYQDNQSQTTHSINMQPLQVEHKIEDVFLEL